MKNTFLPFEEQDQEKGSCITSKGLATPLPRIQDLYKKNFKKNFMAPFYGWDSTASQLQPLRGGSLLFTSQFPRNFWYSFYPPRNDERLSRPWNHLVVLNTRTLDWEPSTLSTRLLLHKIKLNISSATLHHLFPFHTLIPTDWHQEEPLGYSVFGEPNELFTQHTYP